MKVKSKNSLFCTTNCLEVFIGRLFFWIKKKFF